MTTNVHGTPNSCLNELQGLDLIRCAAVLDIEIHGRFAHIPFYDSIYRLSPGQVDTLDGVPPTDAVLRVLCRYLIDCPTQQVPPGRPVTFRELDGAGPLVSSFATNTNKLITSTFSDDLDALEAAGSQMNGARRTDAAGYDLVMTFDALPRIPMLLQFNAADEEFPAQCSLLFNHAAQSYLDMQSLFILGTYLAGGLVRHFSKTGA